jgi:MerR family transcriptional regulator, light-induced transcriptional regulator
MNSGSVHCLNRYNSSFPVQSRFIMAAIDEQTQDNAADLTYRSGVAARLAGLSVETLRVWERRYDLSGTRRSASGQRLYTAAQVQRLGLLKQLVDRGHPIGQLAHLSTDELRALGGGGARAGMPVRPIDIVVIGLGLARRIAASPHDTLLLNVLASCSRFEGAERLGHGLRTDVLLVELSELDEHAIPMIAAASSALHAVAVVVLYRFSPSATIRALRAQGWLVARVPSEMGELVPLCRQALEGQHLPPRAADSPPAGPRFDEETLAGITGASSTLACECPRHMAELLLMVGSFERYSAQCASRNSGDAQVHLDLHQAAGQARMILEAALERLAHADGIPLPPA